MGQKLSYIVCMHEGWELGMGVGGLEVRHLLSIFARV
jgi:hypothetical protein